MRVMIRLGNMTFRAPRRGQIRRFAFLFSALCLLLPSSPGAVSKVPAAESVARDAHLSGDKQRTRFVTVLSRQVKFGVRTLADPYRVIIDMSDVKLNLPAGSGKRGVGLVTGFRYGRVEPHGVRIILDVKAPVIVDKAEIRPAADGYSPRLVVELTRTDRKTFSANQRAGAKSRNAAMKKTRIASRPAAKTSKPRNSKRVIVIDPGHGGIDPGAISRKGLKEKNIVFSFSKTLRDKLIKTGRYEVFMTRSVDSYIALRKRVDLGRSKGADLFISLHADSLPGKFASRVSGATVYTLSEEASDEEAKDLAAKENRSDIIAGVALPTQSDDVTNILIDLAQRETNNLSIGFADALLASLSGKTKFSKKSRRYAGFRVLKAPDVPSVLLELGYMSNRDDVKRFKSQAWRKRVADGVAKAVDSYFAKRTVRNPY
jgi:N-acetylmuramoyl-L-alanine amidase